MKSQDLAIISNKALKKASEQFKLAKQTRDLERKAIFKKRGRELQAVHQRLFNYLQKTYAEMLKDCEFDIDFNDGKVFLDFCFVPHFGSEKTFEVTYETEKEEEPKSNDPDEMGFEIIDVLDESSVALIIEGKYGSIGLFFIDNPFFTKEQKEAIIYACQQNILN